MSALVILLVLSILGLLAYLLWRSVEVPPYEANEPPPDPEKVMQAAVELHAIRRRLDVADVRHRQRQEALRLKRELAKRLDDE